MTDPFADLERELLAAHARAPRRRLTAGAPRVLALAATAAAAVAVVTWVGVQTDAERAVAPTPQPAASGEEAECGDIWRPAETDQPYPSGIGAQMAVFREGRPPRVIELDTRMISAQATRVYRGSLRRLPRTSDYDVFAIVADIVPRRQLTRQRDACSPPHGTTEPGACLVLSSTEGSTAACFTLAEIEGGEAYLDVEDSRIIGFAPDGARVAKADGATAPVEDNLFTLPGGPETTVDFSP